MSTRLGMADGRCLTVSTSSRIFNEEFAYQNGIDVRDNYAYRQFLQANPAKCIQYALQSTACDNLQMAATAEEN